MCVGADQEYPEVAEPFYIGLQRASFHEFVGVDRGKNLAELLESDLTSLVMEMRGRNTVAGVLDRLSPTSRFEMVDVFVQAALLAAIDDPRLGVPEIEGGGPTPPTGDALPVFRALTHVVLRRSCQRFMWASSASRRLQTVRLRHTSSDGCHGRTKATIIEGGGGGVNESKEGDEEE